MKTVKMTMFSRSGQVVNTWSVPHTRRREALAHALDRAEQEGHAGVLWAVFSGGRTREFAFESYDPFAILQFGTMIQPFMTTKGLDIDRYLKHWRAEGVPANAGQRNDRKRTTFA